VALSRRTRDCNFLMDPAMAAASLHLALENLIYRGADRRENRAESFLRGCRGSRGSSDSIGNVVITPAFNIFLLISKLFWPADRWRRSCPGRIQEADDDA
jgi:hypothetical protein